MEQARAALSATQAPEHFAMHSRNPQASMKTASAQSDVEKSLALAANVSA